MRRPYCVPLGGPDRLCKDKSPDFDRSHQDHYVVTSFHRSFKVMRDQQNAAVQSAADLFDQLMEQACSGDIDALGRLVEDQQIGPVNQRPSEQQPLKLAARQGRDRRVAEPFQTDGGKRGVNVMAGKNGRSASSDGADSKAA